jgi:hypothetical protein
VAEIQIREIKASETPTSRAETFGTREGRDFSRAVRVVELMEFFPAFLVPARDLLCIFDAWFLFPFPHYYGLALTYGALRNGALDNEQNHILIQKENP